MGFKTAGCGLVLVVAVVGCQPKPEAPQAPASKSVTVAAGTPVKLLLMDVLESGGTPEGATVPFVVSEDVRDAEGNVVIAKGSPAQGKVTWSRREDMLGGITNRPARLKVDLVEAIGVGGEAIALCTDPNKPDEPYEFNRGNTGTDEASEKLNAILNNEPDKALIEALDQQLNGVDNALLQSDASRARLGAIATELQMPALAELVSKNQLGQVKSAVGTLRGPNSLTAVAKQLDGNGQLMAALVEWTGIARTLGNRLEALTHGRNIKAYVGTPVDAVVEKDGTVKVSVKPK